VLWAVFWAGAKAAAEAIREARIAVFMLKLLTGVFCEHALEGAKDLEEFVHVRGGTKSFEGTLDSRVHVEGRSSDRCAG
jgi:hypothetical protein